MFNAWLVSVYTILGLAFLWLVVAKPVTRVCRRLGVSTPCPYWLGFILILRPGRWCRKRILERVGIEQGDTVLEVGCGLGVFTLSAAKRVGPNGHLHAVDLQPRMIEHTRRAAQSDHHLPLTLHVADARQLPFDDASFDRVFFISALYELTDPAAAVAEAQRVLKPGGVISVTDEFFDPEYRFPRETQRLIESRGFRLQKRLGGWWLHTLNFQRTT